jgi:hypothetical protein
MAMEKYGVSSELALSLVALGVCETEQEALEKVASGEAQGMIKEAKQKLNERVSVMSGLSPDCGCDNGVEE